ncbi:MAG TPA: hypothetical protein VLL94_04675 [Nitrospiraceae bacterium]|nr:hypothetical protein [Nitrospiraceae bacterium]
MFQAVVAPRWFVIKARIGSLRKAGWQCAGLSIQPRQCSFAERAHDHLAHTAIYARLNTKAVDRALQAQADRLCGTKQGLVVLPALTQELQPAA